MYDVFSNNKHQEEKKHPANLPIFAPPQKKIKRRNILENCLQKRLKKKKKSSKGSAPFVRSAHPFKQWPRVWIELPGRWSEPTSVHHKQTEETIKASWSSFELNYCQSRLRFKRKTKKKKIFHTWSESSAQTKQILHLRLDWPTPEEELKTRRKKKYSCTLCVHVILHMHEETKTIFPLLSPCDKMNTVDLN